MNALLPDSSILKLIGPQTTPEIIITNVAGFEGLSQDFQFMIDGFCAENLQAHDWLGCAVSIVIADHGQGSRLFNGVVSQFFSGHYDAQNQRHYQLILSPWLSALQLKQDCRIFQHLTIPEIIQTICHEAGFNDLDLNNLDQKAYKKLSYCVQYNESSYHFIHRLLGEAGIYYYYTHSEKHHTWVLCDAQSTTLANPPQYKYDNSRDAVIREWHPTYTDNQPLRIQGKSILLDLKPNEIFQITPDLENNPRGYRVLQVKHSAQNNTDTHYHSAYQAAHYENQFIVASRESGFTAPTFPKPGMGGPQPAIVTGPAGKAIYTNAQGCVKIKFPWDRENHQDENSSCWVPVLQQMSGEQWGTQFIPRIGDEVIVDFIQDDPDQPLIIGSAYNSSNPPVFPTDNSNQAISGYKTQLIGQNGLTGTGHEFSFDDSAGQEKVSLSSAGDLNLAVLNNLIKQTAGDESVTVNQNDFLTILQGAATLQADTIELRAGGSALILNASGMQLNPAANVYFKAKNVPATAPVVRVNDQHRCPRLTPVLVPHGTNPIAQGSPTMQINGEAAARLNDPINCTGETARIQTGADNITLDGKALAYLKSQTDHHGTLLTGSPNTFVAPRMPIAITIPHPGATQAGVQGGQAIEQTAAANAGLSNSVASASAASVSQAAQESKKFDIHTLHISEKGKNYLKDYEELKLNLYNDESMNCTIGYGHLVHKGPCDNQISEQPYFRGISEDKANQMFNNDVKILGENIVKGSGITAQVTQYQFDALVSFAYNTGKLPEHIVTSVNNEDTDSVCKHILAYHKIHITKSKLIDSSGLLKRRESEVNIYKYGIYNR